MTFFPPLQTFLFFIFWLLLFYLYFFAHGAAGVTVKQATNYTVAIHLFTNLASHLSDILVIHLTTMELSLLSLSHLSNLLQKLAHFYICTVDIYLPLL